MPVGVWLLSLIDVLKNARLCGIFLARITGRDLFQTKACKMKKPILVAAFSALMISPVMANPIERACNQSDRRAASAQLCSCVGYAAEMTLNGAEQRLAARFFSDPDQAQRMRMSDRRNDERFWENYRDFGEAAEAMCG